jgi:hypothetical protein
MDVGREARMVDVTEPVAGPVNPCHVRYPLLILILWLVYKCCNNHKAIISVMEILLTYNLILRNAKIMELWY